MHRLYFVAASAVFGFIVAFAPTLAAAQDYQGKSAGDIRLRARGILIAPDEDSDIDVIGGEAEVGDAFVPELDISYFVTDNIALELIAATARHEVEASGTAIGEVDLGHTWILPPTLTAQYHFMPEQRFSPYLGAGLNYTFFYNEDEGSDPRVNDIDYDNSVGYALQAGMDFAISGAWSLNVDVKKIFLDTDVTVDTALGQVDADVDIDPWIVGIGVGYTF